MNNEDDEFRRIEAEALRLNQSKGRESMTTLRQAAQQALEALRYGKPNKAITILREALEQPEQCKPLTATSILNMMPSSIPAEYDGPLMEFARAIEQALKERNK